jgi:translation initiation factor 1
MNQPGNRRAVWSSDQGRITYCKRCGRPAHVGRCAPAASTAAALASGAPQRDGVVRVTLDRKGRRGKSVTLVMGLPGDDEELEAQAQNLRRLCGAGGTVRDGVVEVQGNHVDRLIAHLVAQGHRVKRAGG